MPEPEPTDPSPSAETLGYGEALAELVEHCRTRIDRARLEVDRVVTALTDVTPAAENDRPPGD